ncbi:hypothetical protein K458DRAFT_145392 [Lentithecium fluviatile CBS 122367]|uniref:Uncharacterized protein n=1 Tax=Lentithecium fluviatile CBS 122367 TaxID=1168545 RepID=A0A6G1II42_9PLEO|nr:hypothetical protein K458DRAFT_145392 [Lentithecium fluviatile CBS 122367]
MPTPRKALYLDPGWTSCPATSWSPRGSTIQVLGVVPQVLNGESPFLPFPINSSQRSYNSIPDHISNPNPSEPYDRRSNAVLPNMAPFYYLLSSESSHQTSRKQKDKYPARRYVPHHTIYPAHSPVLTTLPTATVAPESSSSLPAPWYASHHCPIVAMHAIFHQSPINATSPSPDHRPPSSGSNRSAYQNANH